MNILILGGDERMLHAHKQLIDSGHNVSTLGLIEGDSGDIKSADVLLLPVPTTRDKLHINCPRTNKDIPLEAIYKTKPDCLILTAGFPIKEREYVDYLSLDSFCLLNAVPTAEGAIAKAIAETPFTLWKSRVLVIGFGRVGKILADRLLALKCDVTVSARKSSDFALLDAVGINHIHTYSLKNRIRDFDIIYNTIDVPLPIANLTDLNSSLFIDLSSLGAIDFKKAEEQGIKAFKLPSLPAKCAPWTAGKIIAQTVIDIIGR